MLLRFVDACLGGEAGAVAATRDAVVQVLGQAAMIDAAAVIGGFDGITKVADATGIPLDARVAGPSASWRAELGIDAFQAHKV